VTAIDRDGLLGGPDLDLLRGLVALGHGRIIASGGISSIADVIAVQAAGCAGAIVGRAIYEGRVDLRDLARAVAGLDVG
jgi:phosphoribosylformimino-5-aminoimidazole carboxamide ribotide isomerase